LVKSKIYPAYTLLELLVVISIFIILGGMTFSAFGGLQNTIKMNEYMLNLEQDIRSVQRAAMLLQRNPGEKWIYGLGIDFSGLEEDGVYKVFKWCSPYTDYGDIATKSNIPAFDPTTESGITQGNGTLPVADGVPTQSLCGENIDDMIGALRTLPGYDRTITLPKSNISLSYTDENGDISEPVYVLFESVSGRAFFYDREGDIFNYNIDGTMKESDDIVSFNLEITPQGAGSTRRLSIRHLSGKIDTYMYNK